MHNRTVPPLVIALLLTACDAAPSSGDAALSTDARTADTPPPIDVLEPPSDGDPAPDAASTCASAEDCPSEVCQEPSCESGSCGLAPSPAGTLCDGGECDGEGRCTEATCRFDSDCGGMTAPTCRTLRCLASRCVLFYESIGAPCGAGQCNGDGVCATSCAGAGECPASTVECRAPSCSGGRCDTARVPDGTPCSLGRCLAGHCAAPSAHEIGALTAREQLVSAQGRLYVEVRVGDRPGLAPVDVDARSVGAPEVMYPVVWFDTLRWLTDGDTLVARDYTSQWSGTSWGPLEPTPGGSMGQAMSRDTLWLNDSNPADGSTSFARLGPSGWVVAGTVPIDAQQVWASGDDVVVVSNRSTVVLLGPEGDTYRELARVSLPAHRTVLAAVASDTHVVVSVAPMYGSEVTGHTLEIYERRDGSLAHVRAIPVPVAVRTSLTLSGDHVAGGLADHPTQMANLSTGVVRSLDAEAGGSNIGFTPTHVVIGGFGSLRAFLLD